VRQRRECTEEEGCRDDGGRIEGATEIKDLERLIREVGVSDNFFNYRELHINDDWGT
jgi:hypothetical protein